jgi:CheY-like chemotaxis protein
MISLEGIDHGDEKDYLEKPQYLFLIVDDSHLNRKMMSKLVVAQGHLFELAEDG